MTGGTHYEVLGVAPTASAEEIRAAYRSAARAVHPDAGGSPAAMRRLNAAWHVLRDPGRRALYDRALAGDRPAPATGPADGHDGTASRPGDPPDRSEEWHGVADDLLDATPYGPTAALDGWWALMPPAAVVFAVGLLFAAFVFRSPALFVFSFAAFFVAFGLFVLAPLRAMTRTGARSASSRSDPSDEV